MGIGANLWVHPRQWNIGFVLSNVSHCDCRRCWLESFTLDKAVEGRGEVNTEPNAVGVLLPCNYDKCTPVCGFRLLGYDALWLKFLLGWPHVCIGDCTRCANTKWFGISSGFDLELLTWHRPNLPIKDRGELLQHVFFGGWWSVTNVWWARWVDNLDRRNYREFCLRGECFRVLRWEDAKLLSCPPRKKGSWHCSMDMEVVFHWTVPNADDCLEATYGRQNVPIYSPGFDVRWQKVKHTLIEVGQEVYASCRCLLLSQGEPPHLPGHWRLVHGPWG